MADGLNRVFLLGNIGADPELRVTSTGQSVLKIRMATSESYLDKNRVRQEKTEWHSVVCWGKQAETLGRFLQKGSKIHVEGSLQTQSYDDKDGNKRFKTEVNARHIIMTGGAGAQRRDEPASDTNGGNVDEADDVPY